ncbi:DUF6684 family protein [Halorientalis salina]|uniref:DUF6684 family protein n=1 Tax=Halorientalis salina TaxID=2932266 RepID=UPI0010AC64EF|nr:DUF6684 family protein [Halorientalis salina]
MSSSTFDRDTLLDLTVNAIPLGILLFFIGAFTFANPFGWDGLVSTLQFSIVIITGLLLTILTYYAGKAISEAEAEMEAEGAVETAHADADEDATA